MEKYTVIYNQSFQMGSHRNSITQCKYIECEPKDLKETINDQIGFESVWFIFKGHCELIKSI